MQTYYLYFVGPAGRFVAREDIAADNDDQAIALAEQSFDGRAMELWLGPRRVTTFPAEAGAP